MPILLGGETLIYFIACIIVLIIIAFVIRRAADAGGKPPQPSEGHDTQDEGKQHYTLPFLK